MLKLSLRPLNQPVGVPSSVRWAMQHLCDIHRDEGAAPTSKIGTQGEASSSGKKAEISPKFAATNRE
ncbi:MAG: hypothetical protein ABW185_12635 [Sedimenticola sp.]